MSYGTTKYDYVLYEISRNLPENYKAQIDRAVLIALSEVLPTGR